MRQVTRLASVGAVAGLAALVGCSSSGLSPHEQGQQSMPMMMYTATDNGPGVTGPVRIATPLRVGVAQVGELTPPQSMLDALRAKPDLFARVTPVGGRFGEATTDDPYRRPMGDGPGSPDRNVPSAKDQLSRMRTLAASTGMDYLLVFGGSIEHGHQGSGLELLDLTIVGAFVVPSHGVTVDGRATGSLIDVQTGRVVMTFSAAAKGTGAAPSAFVDNV